MPLQWPVDIILGMSSQICEIPHYTLDIHTLETASSRMVTPLTIEPENRLPLTFKHDTYFFTQEWRDENYAVYSKTKATLGGKKLWEFWKVKRMKARVMFDKPYPAREVPPGDSDFGRWAWSCKDMETAILKVKEFTGLDITLANPRNHPSVTT